MPDARELIDYIHGARMLGEKAGLSNMLRLMSELGNVHEGLRMVHVAGTNGKGSVCALIERALRENGMKTGLYTSPFLTRYNERVRINGAPIDDETLVRYATGVRDASERLRARGVKPTAFELGTALALTAFAGEGADIAVIETGLGGRLDPTNIISPLLCAVTNIGYDHMEMLGDTLPKIAREKAGIIKPRTPVALYPQPPEVDAVFAQTCRERRAPLMRAQAFPIERETRDARGTSFAVTLPNLGRIDARVNLPGAHQAQNARLALCALDLLAERLPLGTVQTARGLSEAAWPGRLEWCGSRALLDGAHNPQGARALRAYLDEYLPDRRVVLLTGMMRDKQPEVYADLLAPAVRRVVATQVEGPRAMDAAALAARYEARGVPATAVPLPREALRRALDDLAGDVLLVAGSLYLIGELREIVLEKCQ